MSDDVLLKLRLRKEAFDKTALTEQLKAWNDFVAQSNESIRKVRESRRHYWIQLAEREMDLAEGEEKVGNRTQAVTHSVTAGNYISLAEMS